jgi:hypothetical protein
MYTITNFVRNKWLEIAIVAFAIQLITNAFSIYLGNNPLLIFLTALGLILVIVLVTITLDAMRRDRRIIDGGNALEKRRKGVIFTIGLKSNEISSPAMKVVGKLKPQYLGFIGTEKTIEANIGRTIAETNGTKSEYFREKSVDPTNVKEIKEDVDHLIQWMLANNLSKEDIVVDLTGGTAIMSVASYIAADENKIDTQYIYSDYRDNKPVDGTQKALMISSYAAK